MFHSSPPAPAPAAPPAPVPAPAAPLPAPSPVPVPVPVPVPALLNCLIQAFLCLITISFKSALLADSTEKIDEEEKKDEEENIGCLVIFSGDQTAGCNCLESCGKLWADKKNNCLDKNAVESCGKLWKAVESCGKIKYHIYVCRALKSCGKM